MRSLLARRIRRGGFVLIAAIGSLAAQPCVASTGAWHRQAEAITQQALAAGLHEDRTWLRLLHFQPDATESEVLSPDFFVAPDGARDPEAELIATLAHWFEPGDDQHARRCRYPARYHWLGQQIAGFNSDAVLQTCEKFQRWAGLDDLQSVSVLMVSGYLGNPASSFGHSLMTLDHGDPRDRNRLLDLSFSFGALVPPQANMFSYVLSGMFGGYEAGFSDKLYYTRDQVYTHTEFRDIWRYQLNLTPDERYMVAAHLWEISGKKFAYYFLTQNCTYRMAEVITLATGQDITPAARLWYAPIELFYRLQATETRGGQPMVSEIDFYPSAQRTLYARFAALSPAGQQYFNDYLQNADDRPLADSSLGETEQQRVLDALLAYTDYRKAGADPVDTQALEKQKQALLSSRLRLPPRTEAAAEPVPVPPPTQEHPTQRAALGIETHDSRTATTLSWAPYFRDDLSSLTPSVREFVVLNTRLSTDFDESTRLDSLELISIRQLRVNNADIFGESNLSWQARLFADRGLFDNDSLAPGASGALGQAWAVTDRWVGYALAGGELRADEKRYMKIGPSFGAVWRQSRVDTEIAGALDYDVAQDRMRSAATLRARLRLNRAWDIRFHGALDDQGQHRAALSLNRFW